MSDISTNTAQSASTFLDSIGINVHMGYTWTSYNNVGLVETSLAYIGVDNVRDKLLDWSNVQANYAQIADAGYKFDFVLPVYDPTTVNLTEFVNMVHDFVLAHPGSVSAIEGANEVNIWPARIQWRHHAGRPGRAAASALCRRSMPIRRWRICRSTI